MNSVRIRKNLAHSAQVWYSLIFYKINVEDFIEKINNLSNIKYFLLYFFNNLKFIKGKDEDKN